MSEIKKNAVRASEIRRRSVGASELRANSVRSSELSDDSVGSGEVGTDALTADDILGGSLDGEVGPDAIARVQPNGTLLPTSPANNPNFPDQSKNFTQANIDRPVPAAPGVYCIRGLPTQPRSAMVTSDSAGASAATDNDVVLSVAVERGNNLAPCNGVAGLPPAQARVVATEVDGTPANVDKGFILWLEF